MCECGIVPVIRRMIAKGMPVSCGLTYLLAAPIVNPIVAVSTYAAFRGQDPWLVAGLRIGIGYAVACIIGFVVLRLPMDRVLNREMLRVWSARRASTAAPMMQYAAVTAGAGGGGFSLKAPLREVVKRGPGLREKLAAAVRCAGYDFLDVGAYLVVGAAVTSVFNTAVDQQVIAPLASHHTLATGAMMVLAGLLSLCSTSDAFIAANFVAFPLSAKLAFMTFGPMMDVKLLFMYGLVFQRKFTVQLAVGLFLIVGLACLLPGRWPQ